MAKYRGHSTEENAATGGYMGAWSYVGLIILYAIPLIGLIFCIAHACNMKHENRCHFARSYFCMFLVAVLFAGLVLAVYGVARIAGVTSITDKFEEIWADVRSEAKDRFEEFKQKFSKAKEEIETQVKDILPSSTPIAD